MNLDTITWNIFLLKQDATLTQTECHDRADIGSVRDHGSTDKRLVDMINQSRVRQASRIMYLDLLPFLCMHDIRNVRYSSYHIHIELTIQTLLNNLHMQQAQETATEPKTQRGGTLRLESQGSVVQLQFLQWRTKVLEILAINWIDTGEDHRLHLLKTGDRVFSRARHMSDRITDTHLPGRLDTGNDISYVSRPDLLTGAPI